MALDISIDHESVVGGPNVVRPGESACDSYLRHKYGPVWRLRKAQLERSEAVAVGRPLTAEQRALPPWPA